MVGKESILVSADNCGIIYARCINLSSSLNLNEFTLSSVVRTVPKILDFSKPLKKKNYLGLVISLKKITMRPQGVWLRFNKNRILNLNDSYKFLGTRVYGPLCREIRSPQNRSRYKKIISYSRVSI